MDRLGLFSVQTRLPETTSWQTTFDIGGRAVGVHGASNLGRPHGADADLVLGLQQLFLQQGAPEDGWVHTTSNALRDASMMTKNGRAFHRMREGLLRIWSAGFIVSEGWRKPDGSIVRLNDAFRVIDQFRFWDQTSGGEVAELLPDCTLSVRLGAPVADSLRAGFLHPLSRTILESLEQPTSRALYRLVEAHRYNDDGTVSPTLRVNLLDWRAACGIVSGDSDKIRRVLEPAHDELTANGYLRDLVVTGRGQSTTLEYVFLTEADPDPALVRMLREQGVGGPRAVQLARDHPDLIPEAVAFLRHRREFGGVPVRSPGGLMADFLVNRDKYEYESTSPGISSAPADARREKALAAQREAEQEAERAAAEKRSRVLLLSPVEQWQAEATTLKLLLRRELSSLQHARLEALALSGAILAAELAQQASRARAGTAADWQAFVAALRDQLTE
jgi:plasmid replication initiation protein